MYEKNLYLTLILHSQFIYFYNNNFKITQTISCVQVDFYFNPLRQLKAYTQRSFAHSGSFSIVKSPLFISQYYVYFFTSRFYFQCGYGIL